MLNNPRRTVPAAWSLMLVALGVVAPAQAADQAADWDFAVLLDTRPIGTHRFELRPADDGERSLLSEARFEVRILGFTAYRYRHRAQERWSGDCLASIDARTDDDGEVTVVSGQLTDGSFKVVANAGSKPVQAEARSCMVSFAYWNPGQLARQRQLLDQGTGRIEPVTISALPATTIEVHGEPTSVTGLRISGLKAPIDVWYMNERWVGLDTTADGGRKLAYRLL
jgi:Domain of unknown function (DUF6134)